MMGSKKVKTTQTNKPIYAAEIGGAAKNVQDAYNQTQPAINTLSNNLGQVSSDLFAGMQGGNNAVLNANNFVNQQLTGDPQQNPYLQQQIDTTNESVRNQLQARMGRAGLAGGSDYNNLIARALAQNESGLRYADYDNAMNRRFQAAGLAPQGLQTAAGLGQAGAMLPLQAGALNAASVGGLLGQYQNQQGTQKQTGVSIGELLGAGLQAASLFSDRRLKTDIRRVGKTDAGVPIYTYRYLGEGPYHMGVMADDVPDALGPVIEGFKTVRYEAVA
jgi:hypothetical protein